MPQFKRRVEGETFELTLPSTLLSPHAERQSGRRHRAEVSSVNAPQHQHHCPFWCFCVLHLVSVFKLSDPDDEVASLASSSGNCGSRSSHRLPVKDWKSSPRGSPKVKRKIKKDDGYVCVVI